MYLRIGDGATVIPVIVVRCATGICRSWASRIVPRRHDDDSLLASTHLRTRSASRLPRGSGWHLFIPFRQWRDILDGGTRLAGLRRTGSEA